MAALACAASANYTDSRDIMKSQILIQVRAMGLPASCQPPSSQRMRTAGLAGWIHRSALLHHELSGETSRVDLHDHGSTRPRRGPICGRHALTCGGGRNARTRSPFAPACVRLGLDRQGGAGEHVLSMVSTDEGASWDGPFTVEEGDPKGVPNAYSNIVLAPRLNGGQNYSTLH